MPPKRKQKAKSKEDAERKKEILSAKERILAKKRFILTIVEKMIEDGISKEWFLSNCSYLCQADFDDVAQERSIETLCGYPLCSNIIKQTLKQKYQIWQNKVYDIIERKWFCSNHCYKASNYVKAQLSPIPLYMRKEEVIKVHLISDCDNKGSAGEEVIFCHKISPEEIDEVYTEETPNNLQNLLNEEVKKCADSLSGLEIKEHVFEKQYVFSDETPNMVHNSALKDENKPYSESEIDSDDSIDEKLFPNYDNESALSNRYMPIPERTKKSVLIPVQTPELKSVSQTNELSLHFVRKIFEDWMTTDTLKYLMGEKHVYGVKADKLVKTIAESELSCSEKLASIKDAYVKLCLKIDNMPDDDDYIIDSSELDLTSESNPKSNNKKIEVENNSVKKVFKRRPRKSKDKNKNVTCTPESKKGDLDFEEKDMALSEKEKDEISNESIAKIDEKSNDKNKHVTFAPDSKKADLDLKEKDIKLLVKKKDEISYKSQEEVDENVVSKNVEIQKELPSEIIPEPEPAFPLVDSVSQNILRRQILSKKLKSVYTELLPIAGLHYTDIREDVKKFVDSLSLTPTNITYKPKEWKLISLVLFRMLTRTVLKDLHDELQFAKLCEDPFLPITVDLREIENLVCELVSMENIY